VWPRTVPFYLPGLEEILHQFKVGSMIPGSGGVGKEHSTNFPYRVWKPKKTKRKMVLGMDIRLVESCSLALCPLVGRLSYHHFCNRFVLVWMKDTWEPILGYSLVLLHLPRGWFEFIFNSLEDSTRILEKFRVFEGCSLMLKRWRLKFDTTSKYFSFRHMWVLLLDFPLQFWNQKALEAIENTLGRFIKLDEDALLSNDRRMAKILVEIDIHGGLLENLDREW